MSFQAYLKNLLGSFGGGGEDPPKKKVYTSQKDIDRDNLWLRDFLTRHGAPGANNMVVARDIGDPMPKFITPDGKPYQVDKPLLPTTLPFGVSINDVYQTNEGQYGYMHPQNGNFVQVDPQAVYSKYGAKK